MPGLILSAAARIIDPAGTGALTLAAQNDVTGAVATCRLCAIQATPTAPACGIGAIVIAIGDSLYGGQILDPSGRLLITVGPFEVVVLVAQESLTWMRIPGDAVLATIVEAVALASGGGTLGVGSANVPGVIATPSKLAGFVPVVLPDGSVGWTPYWK